MVGGKKRKGRFAALVNGRQLVEEEAGIGIGREAGLDGLEEEESGGRIGEEKGGGEAGGN